MLNSSKTLMFFLSLGLFLQACGNPPRRNSLAKQSLETGPIDGGRSEGDVLGDQPPGDGSGDSKPDGNSARDPETVGEILDPKADCANEKIGAKPMLRLMTRDKYQNTVRDVLGVKTDYRAGLPIEIGKGGFNNNADVGTISDSHVASYLEAAIQIADEIRPNLRTLAGCVQTENADCAKKVLDNLAPSLWRRPLVAEESQELLALYNSVPKESMTALLTRILTSAHFLYRSELGTGGELNAYELASALSYFFWGTVPDKTLNDLAKNASILKEDVLLAQATRLMDDPKSSFMLRSFSDAWLSSKRVLSSTKDAKVFPKWNGELQAMMAAESQNTFEFWVRQANTKFNQMLLSDYSIGPPALAQFYGSSSKKEGGVDKIIHTSENRRGVLGFGSILGALASNTESHPIKRGNFVLDHLLCHVPPPVPEGLEFQIPAKDPTKSTRERFAAHTVAPQCKSCHLQIDGIGLAMEDFDGIGLFRTTDNGKPVDISGELVGFDGANSKFNGTAELSKLLANSAHAKRCYALQWYRYSHGHIERKEDICSVRALADEFQADKFSLKDLIIQMITHKSYRNRGN